MDFVLKVKGSEIVAHLEKRIERANENIQRLEAQRIAIKNLGTQPVPRSVVRHGALGEGGPVYRRPSAMIGAIPTAQFKRFVQQLEFLRDHIEAETMYSLNYRELEALGLVPSTMYGGDLDDDDDDDEDGLGTLEFFNH